jgi:hypothetical protein
MTEVQTTETPSGPAYSIKQITVAAFLGGPLAAFWLLAANYRLFRQSRNALFAIVAGILGTIAILAIAVILPPWFPNVVLPIAYTLGLRGLADILQGALLDEHVRNGGRVGSWWVVIGVSVLGIVVLVGLAFAFALLFPNALPSGGTADL